MNAIRHIAALAVAALVVAAPCAQAERVAKEVTDYTVFVDPPTGFVFVKLPTGWKFVAKVDASEVAKLPSSVVTALLTDDDDDATTRFAAGTSRPASGR
jgi:hypothetical protein